MAEWRDHAYRKVKVYSVLPFCDDAGDFAYQGFTEIAFPEWTELAKSPDYPEDFPGGDWLENRVAMIFSEAIDTLAQDGSFDKLRLASPTLLGFGFHDQDQYVVRMLRVPNT
jgi:hypothetical protein